MTTTMTYVGLDVHARSTHAAALEVLSGELHRARFGVGASGGPLSEDALLAALASMLDAPTAELTAFIARHLTDDRVRERIS